MKRLLLLTAAVTLINCTSPADTHKALEAYGFTNINPGGYAGFSCGQDDFYKTKFTATNTIGVQVSGVVCSGLIFKESTVRF